MGLTGVAIQAGGHLNTETEMQMKGLSGELLHLYSKPRSPPPRPKEDGNSSAFPHFKRRSFRHLYGRRGRSHCRAYLKRSLQIIHKGTDGVSRTHGVRRKESRESLTSGGHRRRWRGRRRGRHRALVPKHPTQSSGHSNWGEIEGVIAQAQEETKPRWYVTTSRDEDGWGLEGG